MKQKTEEWIVSDKTCKGCMYYGNFNWSSRDRCCLYTVDTGRIRVNPPATCEVKEIGKRKYKPYR